jgi:hypothetical protein
MTMTTVGLHSMDELCEPDSEDGPSDEEGNPPKPGHLVVRSDRAVTPRPNGVWFGPKGSEATERELIAFLGSHNGVAVLQWPRDAHRAERFFDLGIPCLWFVQDAADLPPARGNSEEWLLQAASDCEVHECLERLSDSAVAQRSAAPELEDDGWLHIGEHGIQLTPPESCLAAPLIAHFGEAVDDDLLTLRSAPAVAARRNSTFASELDHLGEDCKSLGLEVVRATERRHLIRRCR